MIRYCSVVLVVLMSGFALGEQKPLEEVLLAQELKLVDAIKQQDKATLKKMLAHQVYSVTPGAGRETSEQTLRRLNNVTINSYNLSDAKAVRIGEDSAILTFKFTWEGTRNGKPTSTTVFSTVTWALRDGQWVTVFYQETPLPADAAKGSPGANK